MKRVVPALPQTIPHAKSSYDPAFFRTTAAAEERHFWYRYRGQVIGRLAGQVAANLASRCRILEVGCGTGGTLRRLEQACPNAVIVGVDIFTEALRYARQHTACFLVEGDIAALPFGTHFHVIGLFDVLEHLPDDLHVLQSLYDLLTPGGALMVTVPAHPCLWSYFDLASRHCRRYKPAELEEKLEAAGYRIEYLTQFMAALLPVLWLSRRLASCLERGERNDAIRAQKLAAREFRVIPVINKLMGWILSLELSWIGARRRLPMGTSLLAIARKE